MKNQGQQVLIALLVLVTSSGCQSVMSQFLQPQSHLGRLVQSISSPFLLSGDSRDHSDSYDPDAPSSPPSTSSSSGLSYPSIPDSGLSEALSDNSGAGESAAAVASGAEDGDGNYPQEQQTRSPPRQHHNHHLQQQHRLQQQQHKQQQHQALQQAPSQQRGVPQRYYRQNHAHSYEDKSAGAPGNQKQAQEYQMGAYLGPTIDDKEINGAFNSNNDDDDDGPAGYDGPPSSAGGRHRAASSQPAGSDSGSASLFGGARDAPTGYSPYNSRPEAATSAYNNYDDDDESAADEDEGPASGRAGDSGRPRHFRSGMNQATAASQYRQQQQQRSQPARRQQPMLAAANGYAPYGYAAGPVDLNSLIAAAAGGDPSGGYQVYNGDGSYPGDGYYQQQRQQQRGPRGGSHNQAASMNNPNANYYGGQNPGYGNQSGGGSDNDEQDPDMDDD